MDELHAFLRNLTKANKLACMRSLEFGGGVNSDAVGIQEDPIVTPSG